MSAHPTSQALLQAALLIVDRDGIEALTIRALVRESGVSNGSIYHHVGSLEQLRSLVAGEAVKIWADTFLSALRADGYAAAAAADLTWARRHPALAQLIETEGRQGQLGDNARHFSAGLRGWLDEHDLGIQAPANLVSAIMIGPLVELRRFAHMTQQRPRAADLHTLGRAVTAALAALNPQPNDAQIQ